MSGDTSLSPVQVDDESHMYNYYQFFNVKAHHLYCHDVVLPFTILSCLMHDGEKRYCSQIYKHIFDAKPNNERTMYNVTILSSAILADINEYYVRHFLN